MSQKNETAVLALSLLITAALLGGGFWWFTRGSGFNISNASKDDNTNTPTQQQTSQTFSPPTSVPSGTTVRIDGSTSMVQINQALKNSFEQQFPGTTVNTSAGGTEKGIQDLLAGNIDIAAISRPLTSQEQTQGLVAVPVTKDAIAIVIGEKNPFRRGLTQDQARGIFQGQITDWSKVGGTAGPIRVINRPPGSGTHQIFQEFVLQGQNFGTTPNFTTLSQDATTPLLRALGTSGIGYATYSQVANQQTVRAVPIDGVTPEASSYPYQRTLYYAYKNPPIAQVQSFLGYVSSEKGKGAIASANESSK
jgi:phosphate transport system substrate-binding protein